MAEPTFPIAASPFPRVFPGLRRQCSARAHGTGQLSALPTPRLQDGGTEVGGDRSQSLGAGMQPQTAEQREASAMHARSRS